jgi:hypothetical protein
MEGSLAGSQQQDWSGSTAYTVQVGVKLPDRIQPTGGPVGTDPHPFGEGVEQVMNREALLLGGVDPVSRCELLGAAGLMESGIAERLSKVIHGIAEVCAFEVDDTGDDRVTARRDQKVPVDEVV